MAKPLNVDLPTPEIAAAPDNYTVIEELTPGTRPTHKDSGPIEREEGGACSSRSASIKEALLKRSSKQDTVQPQKKRYKSTFAMEHLYKRIGGKI